MQPLAAFLLLTGGAVTYTLTVVEAGSGAGTTTGAGTYPPGTVVTPTALPAPGSTFDGWDLPVPVTMDADTKITATFTLITAGPPPPPHPDLAGVRAGGSRISLGVVGAYRPR